MAFLSIAEQAKRALDPLVEQSITGGLTPEQEAEGRTAGFRGALQKQFAARLPGVKRRKFSGFAERGFGMSNVAEEGVREAIASEEAERLKIEQEKLLGVSGQIRQERAVKRGLFEKEGGFLG